MLVSTGQHSLPKEVIEKLGMLAYGQRMTLCARVKPTHNLGYDEVVQG